MKAADGYRIAVNLSGLAYDGELTFVGVLRKYFVEWDDWGNNIGISKWWSDGTQENYRRDYENRLLPVMVQLFGTQKPMHEYLEEDFERILEKLREQHHYADSTMLHYRHLLWVVYEAGFEHGLYEDNIFWDDIIDLEDESEEKAEKNRIEIRTRVRKSLDIEEEIRLVRWFQGLDPRTATGEEVGFALMYWTGLRNNEVCGGSFGNVYELDAYPDMPVFGMLNSTMIDSNRLKAGGKTANAPRVLPLFRPLYFFLMERKRYLEELLAKGELILPEGTAGIKDLPVACVGRNYTERASSRALTKVGREVFARIGIQKSKLALLQQILFSTEFRQTEISEKEPTTYLLRRNLATHLYQMEFSLAEIQYWMGHDIEDPVLTRNSFADEDTLYNLGQRFQWKHPLRILFDWAEPAGDVVSKDASVRKKSGVSEETFFLKAEKSASRFRMTIDAREPNDSIGVTIENCSEEDRFRAVVYTAESLEPCADVVEIGKHVEAYVKDSTQ